MLQVTTTSRPPIGQPAECGGRGLGGEAEINQAVAAAKEAFPKRADLPMKERARHAPSGDWISPERARDRRDGNRGTLACRLIRRNVLIPRAFPQL
ncbi:hypothetical protein ACNKHU_27330 [Shigella flexneri]